MKTSFLLVLLALVSRSEEEGNPSEKPGVIATLPPTTQDNHKTRSNNQTYHPENSVKPQYLNKSEGYHYGTSEIGKILGGYQYGTDVGILGGYGSTINSPIRSVNDRSVNVLSKTIQSGYGSPKMLSDQFGNVSESKEHPQMTQVKFDKIQIESHPVGDDIPKMLSDQVGNLPGKKEHPEMTQVKLDKIQRESRLVDYGTIKTLSDQVGNFEHPEMTQVNFNKIQRENHPVGFEILKMSSDRVGSLRDSKEHSEMTQVMFNKVQIESHSAGYNIPKVLSDQFGNLSRSKEHSEMNQVKFDKLQIESHPVVLAQTITEYRPYWRYEDGINQVTTATNLGENKPVEKDVEESKTAIQNDVGDQNKTHQIARAMNESQNGNGMEASRGYSGVYDGKHREYEGDYEGGYGGVYGGKYGWGQGGRYEAGYERIQGGRYEDGQGSIHQKEYSGSPVSRHEGGQEGSHQEEYAGSQISRQEENQRSRLEEDQRNRQGGKHEEGQRSREEGKYEWDQSEHEGKYEEGQAGIYSVQNDDYGLRYGGRFAGRNTNNPIVNMRPEENSKSYVHPSDQEGYYLGSIGQEKSDIGQNIKGSHLAVGTYIFGQNEGGIGQIVEERHITGPERSSFADYTSRHAFDGPNFDMSDIDKKQGSQNEEVNHLIGQKASGIVQSVERSRIIDQERSRIGHQVDYSSRHIIDGPFGVSYIGQERGGVGQNDMIEGKVSGVGGGGQEGSGFGYGYITRQGYHLDIGRVTGRTIGNSIDVGRNLPNVPLGVVPGYPVSFSPEDNTKHLGTQPSQLVPSNYASNYGHYKPQIDLGHVTITHRVRILVVPVEVEKKIPVPVVHKVPVYIHKPYRVQVVKPVFINKPVPYPVYIKESKTFWGKRLRYGHNLLGSGLWSEW